MSHQADHLALAGCPLLADVPAAQLEAIMPHGTRQTLAAQQSIYTQGDAGATFYVVVAGLVELTRQAADGAQALVYRGREGSVLGLMAALAGQPRATHARTLGPAALWGWSAATFAAAARDLPALHANLLGYLGTRYMHLWTRYSELRQLSVEQRLACTLVRLAAAGTAAADGAIAIDLPFSRQDLADIIGTTIFTTSRLMSSWERDGLLGGGRNRLLIYNLPALTQIGDAVATLPPADLPNEDRA